MLNASTRHLYRTLAFIGESGRKTRMVMPQRIVAVPTVTAGQLEVLIWQLPGRLTDQEEDLPGSKRAALDLRDTERDQAGEHELESLL